MDTLLKNFTLHRCNTKIAKADFEAAFVKTDERVTLTFNGWDGKSYNGQSRKARVYRVTIPGFEALRLVKVGKALHFINEPHMILEKATGEYHPEANWLIDVARA